MSVNGITNAMGNDYITAATTQKSPAGTTPQTKAEDLGVVYEPSKEATESTANKTTDYSAIITKLNNDLDARTKHLQDLVNQLLGKQANKFTSLADMYRNLQVDPETVKAAQEEISEDGYWGVEQTSDRMVSMAQALCGGDTSKADTMINAMKKGFEEALGAWGEDLPEICQKTIDTAIEKMEAWRDGTDESTAE